jgi:hypothetical protein
LRGEVSKLCEGTVVDKVRMGGVNKFGDIGAAGADEAMGRRACPVVRMKEVIEEIDAPSRDMRLQSRIK